MDELADQVDQYMLHDDEPEMTDVVKYVAIIRDGAASKMYTSKSIEARFEIVKNLF